MDFLLQKQLKIRNAGAVWLDFNKIPPPVEINFKDVEEIDGAGLQLIINFLNLCKNSPENYTLNNFNKKLKETMENFGYSFTTEGDIK